MGGILLMRYQALVSTLYRAVASHKQRQQQRVIQHKQLCKAWFHLACECYCLLYIAIATTCIVQSYFAE